MFKLCGGTLFVLLLNSKKKGSRETSIIQDMLKVFYPNIFISSDLLKEQTKKFKICKEHSTFASQFEDTAMQKRMIDDIHERYDELLNRTADFIEKYVDADSDTHKDEILVKAVLEVIEQDTSISDDQEFFILPNGKSVTKERLVSIKKIYLPSFMLGLLFYVMMNVKDNKSGAETYEKWCPKPASGTKRYYTANLGENSIKQIELINTPDQYSREELLDLAGEQITFFVKPLPTDENYDITITSIVAIETIDDSEKKEYFQLPASISDIETLKDFVAKCNELICRVRKLHSSNKCEDIKSLALTKRDFYHQWIVFPHRYENRLTQKWCDFILSKIEQSKSIDIYNVTIVPTYINPQLDKLPVLNKHLNPDVKEQKLTYFRSDKKIK